MIVFPNAKINIGLNVVSKRNDGYHNLETFFYPVNLADALEVIPSDEIGFTVSGFPVDGKAENNLVLKAYYLMQSKFNLPPVKFHLHKNIPIGAGLGGGSSDAAFTLKLLNNLFHLKLNNETLESLAATIGADCAFFIRNKPSFAHGIGDKLEPTNLNLEHYHILIAMPGITVNTSQAFRNIIPLQPEFSLKNIHTVDVNDWKKLIKNDFENSIFPQFPEIGDLKEAFYKMGAVYASMSGSGSAVYGIFRHLPTNINKFLPKGIFIYR